MRFFMSVIGRQDDEGAAAADAGRIVYAGHSMGGHGAWVLATSDPDRALGVVVGAGWTSKEKYGSSNNLFEHVSVPCLILGAAVLTTKLRRISRRPTRSQR